MALVKLVHPRLQLVPLPVVAVDYNLTCYPQKSPWTKVLVNEAICRTSYYFPTSLGHGR